MCVNLQLLPSHLPLPIRVRRLLSRCLRRSRINFCERKFLNVRNKILELTSQNAQLAVIQSREDGELYGIFSREF